MKKHFWTAGALVALAATLATESHAATINFTTITTAPTLHTGTYSPFTGVSLDALSFNGLTAGGLFNNLQAVASTSGVVTQSAGLGVAASTLNNPWLNGNEALKFTFTPAQTVTAFQVSSFGSGDAVGYAYNANTNVYLPLVQTDLGNGVVILSVSPAQSFTTFYIGATSGNFYVQSLTVAVPLPASLTGASSLLALSLLRRNRTPR